MTTFQPQQPDRGRCVLQNGDANALQIQGTKRATELHGHCHEARKIWCNHFQRALQEHVNEWSFYTREALPLVKTRFLRLANSSPMTARSPARQPRDGRELSGKTSGGISCAMSAQLPGNGRSVAETMPPDVGRDNRRRAERCPGGDRQDNLQSASGNNAECPASLRRANLPEFRLQFPIHDIQKL
jgi:hypothetical protein